LHSQFRDRAPTRYSLGLPYRTSLSQSSYVGSNQSGSAAVAAIEKGAELLENSGSTRITLGNPRVLRKGSLLGAPYYWDLMHTVPAYQIEGYSKAVPTLFDSTSTSGQYSYFQVIAHTNNPSVFYTSEPDSAYSVDNIAPAAPASLIAMQPAAQGVELTWDPNTEPDLSHYIVYRGTDAGFVPGSGNQLTTTLLTTQADGSWTWDSGYWYKVSAVDIHENESFFAVVGPGLVTATGEAAPGMTHLEQNIPNPFNPTTSIGFTLVEASDVSLVVYDSSGRLVRTLVDGRRDAKQHNVLWDGRNDAGALIATGVYFYRLTAPGFSQTRKMVLLK
jgi:hypothetical protein